MHINGVIYMVAIQYENREGVNRYDYVVLKFAIDKDGFIRMATIHSKYLVSRTFHEIVYLLMVVFGLATYWYYGGQLQSVHQIPHYYLDHCFSIFYSMSSSFSVAIRR